MSSSSSLSELRQRILRFEKKVKMLHGEGFTQKHQVSDDTTYSTRINGVKPLDDFRDEVETLAVWIWSLKDYMKETARGNGKNPQLIEDFIDNHFNLLICSDLANGAKHCNLKKSRSNRFAKIKDVGIQVPGHSFQQITVLSNQVILDVKHVEQVKYTAPVEDQYGHAIGDAVEMLYCAMQDWEDAICLFA